MYLTLYLTLSSWDKKARPKNSQWAQGPGPLVLTGFEDSFRQKHHLRRRKRRLRSGSAVGGRTRGSAVTFNYELITSARSQCVHYGPNLGPRPRVSRRWGSKLGLKSRAPRRRPGRAACARRKQEVERAGVVSSSASTPPRQRRRARRAACASAPRPRRARRRRRSGRRRAPRARRRRGGWRRRRARRRLLMTVEGAATAAVQRRKARTRAGGPPLASTASRAAASSAAAARLPPARGRTPRSPARRRRPGRARRSRGRSSSRSARRRGDDVRASLQAVQRGEGRGRGASPSRAAPRAARARRAAGLAQGLLRRQPLLDVALEQPRDEEPGLVRPAPPEPRRELQRRARAARDLAVVRPRTAGSRSGT